MGLITSLTNKRIFLDTSPIIYFIEDHPKYGQVLVDLLKSVDSEQIRLFTSTLTLMEVLVQPLRFHRHDLVEQYKLILTTSDAITMINMDILIAVEAAKIRAKYNFKTPDSIQLATAINCQADYFFTNDKSLRHDNLSVVILDSLLV